MQNFEFLSSTKIIFGRETEQQVGSEVQPFSRRILLHYGGGSIKQTGLYDRVAASLQAANIDFVELGGVKPNPRLSLVREGIALCRKEGLDFILAVGGGSVIDSAKAIGVGTVYEGDVWDFYSEKALPERTLPTGVILTIAAAGSEASKSSVITKEEGWYKRPLNDNLTRPCFAILNPELTTTVSPYQTSCGAVDIFAHVFERYFTAVKDVDFTDRLCEAAMQCVMRNAPIALEQPADYAARAELMWAGTIAHNDLLSTGRIGDFGSHKIEHELSAIYDVAHGAGLAVVIPAWMQYVYQQHLDRFVQFAHRVCGVEMDFASPERTAVEGITRLKAFFQSIGMPVTLGELGIDTSRLEEMAAKCTETGPVGSLVPLQEDDVRKILKLAV